MKKVILLALLLSGFLCAAVSPDEKANELYEKGYKLVLEKDWAKASDIFNELLSKYASSSWADDAQFWLCYSIEKSEQNLEASFDCYSRFIEKYPESKWHDDAMQNMVRLAEELDKQDKPVYRERLKMIENKESDEVSLAVLHALQSRGDEKALEAVLKIFDSTKNENIRKKMVYIIGSFEDNQAREKLISIAKSDNQVEMRADALFWLAQNRTDKNTAEFIKDRALNDPDEKVQKKALFSLSEMADDTGMQYLYEIAENHKNSELRENAVFWIGENAKNKTEALKKLKEYAINDKDFNVRKKAIFFFFQVDNEEAMDLLISLSKDLQDIELRSNALFWLSQNARSEKHYAAISYAANNDPEYKVRKKAIFAISQLPQNVAQKRLIEIAEKHTDADLRSEAVFWLSQLETNTEILKKLKEIALTDNEQKVQEKAVFSLYEMDNDAGIKDLIDIAKNHKNIAIRKKAIFWLGQSGADEAVKALEDILFNQPK
ncbi:MAG: HEAT repeat domain-containing protein [Calditrichaeota bacterium]|nr:HEAT repeat domain-containing protein [Calditrichota bacterium]